MRQDNSEKEAYNLVLFHETPKAYLVGGASRKTATPTARCGFRSLRSAQSCLSKRTASNGLSS